jgi:hypothetical protein
VEDQVTEDRNLRRRQLEAIVLDRRDNSIVDESAEPPDKTPVPAQDQP